MTLTWIFCPLKIFVYHGLGFLAGAFSCTNKYIKYNIFLPMKINIKNQDVELKFNFKSEMYFESIQKESFTGKNTTEWILLFFCYVIAMTDDGFINYDDFIDWVSSQPVTLYDFIAWYTEEMTNISNLRIGMKEDEEKKKGQTGRARKSQK